MKTYQEALSSIYFRIPRGVKLGLPPVREACERAGSPHLAFPVIHIGGTNGKGSVAAMVSSVLREAGYHVGLFTSPHLCRFAERIQVDGQPIAEDVLVDVLNRSIELGPSLTFFETVFLTASIAFRDLGVDAAVLEVGLGGRLDATNVVEGPIATGITRIAFDHMDKLGQSLEEIAREKAGIAKPGSPMILGPMPDNIDALIRKHASSLGASNIMAVGREIPLSQSNDEECVVHVPGMSSITMRPSLAGAHQFANAAVVAGLCGLARSRLPAITEDTIAKGVNATRWPGRLEKINTRDGIVMIDSAHNPDGAQSLAQHLMRMERDGQRSREKTAMVFGALADKAWREMLNILGPLCDHRFYVEPGGRAPAPTQRMAEAYPGSPRASVREALDEARAKVGPSGLVIVAGSIFLAGEARALLLGLERDPPVSL